MNTIAIAFLTDFPNLGKTLEPFDNPGEVHKRKESQICSQPFGGFSSKHFGFYRHTNTVHIFEPQPILLWKRQKEKPWARTNWGRSVELETRTRSFVCDLFRPPPPPPALTLHLDQVHCRRRHSRHWSMAQWSWSMTRDGWRVVGIRWSEMLWRTGPQSVCL